MQNHPDAQLLRQYAGQRSEAAFSEIVARHAGLVYSAALRQLDSPDLARDVAQSVFTDLARKAASLADKLSSDASLAGWLYRSTRFAARDAARGDRRRQARERQVMQQFDATVETAQWEQVRPVLDEAMAELSDEDREAVLLRYFEQQDLHAVGQALGVSDDAAQKRVSRALERLRAGLTIRGVTTTAGALAALLVAETVSFAPAGLAATLSTAALAGTTLATTATATATKTIAMTTLQKTLIAATITAAVGTGIYEARQASALRTEVETLRQQQAPFANQVQQLTNERDAAAGQLAALRNDNERLKRDAADILRLRGDTARLRQSEQELAQMKAADAQKRSDPAETEAKSLLARVKQLKQQLDQMPDKKIPELQFVTDKDWLIAVTKNPGETDVDSRKALLTLRNHGKLAFAPMLRGALQEYINANNGLLPADIAQLRPFFQSPVDDAILQRYQLLHTGKLSDVPPEEWLVAEKAPVDTEYDSRLRINNTSISMVGIDDYPKRP